MRGLLRLLPLVLIGLFAWTSTSAAHEVRPALLQIDQTGPAAYRVLWKRPVMGDAALRLKPHLSSGWLEAPPADQYVGAGFLVTTWTVRTPQPLSGQTLTIEGLDQSLTDVLVQARAGGHALDAVVKPQHPSLELRLAAPRLATPAYLRLGVGHILGGVDHLAFVLGLLLLVGPNRNLVKAITAFTVAHSLTLAAAVLGWVTAPAAVVEALVALSIVFVAVELGRDPGAPSLTRRAPWIVAFAFGLMHGLAFAGGLVEIGLPRGAVAGALLLFNLGVEIGQLMFVAAVLALIWALRRPPATLPQPALARLAPAYLIGSFAAFWFLERLQSAFA